MNIYTSVLASECLEYILQSANQQIEKVQLIKKLPQFINADLAAKINFQFQVFVNDHELNTVTGMREQHLSEIKLLQKDSMMPKGIDRQSQQIDKVDKMDESLTKKKKGMNNTRSSFNRSNIHSMQNTNRNSKISQFSKNKSKKVNQNLISLQSYVEDPEIQKLWKLKDHEVQLKQKQKKAEQAKRKSFEEKKSNFQKQISDKGYTFDFEGDPFISTQDEEKINYHYMKMKLSLMDKKLRSNINFKDKESSIDVKVQKKPSISFKQQQSFSVQFAPIPVFQNQGASGDSAVLFGLPSEMNKCKLKEYKKHYGGRFTRLDRSTNTIQATSQKNDEYNQIFSERRYLKDEQKTINQSMVSYRTRIDQATRRRLALPKIHGKYSTLDRYQNF